MAFQKDGGVYHVTSDKGSYDVSRKVVGLNITFKNIHRSSVGGMDMLDLEKKEVTYERSLSGEWTGEHAHFELISEEGEKITRAPGHFYIKPAPFEHSSLSHWEASDEEPEQFYLALYVADDWFNWLWNEITAQPNATVGCRIKFMPWLSGMEAHMWYEDSFRAVRLEPKGQLEILALRFHLGVPSKLAEEAATDPTTVTEKIEAALETTDTGVWLKRIFWAVVILGIVLLWRR